MTKDEVKGVKHFTLLIAAVVVMGGCASISESTFTSDPSNPQNVIVEKAIWSYLNTPTGELTKTDLERVTGLDLYRTNISDAILRELAKCKKLEGLSLDSTQISDAGLKGLAKLTQLKGLRVQQTKVTKAGVAQLQKALPECHIVSDADK